jgi:hypothetical protein
LRIMLDVIVLLVNTKKPVLALMTLLSVLLVNTKKPVLALMTLLVVLTWFVLD